MRVLFIDIDTLRPDHMSCYGYHRNTTPNLDRVCSDGVRFDNYYCSDAPCLPSRAALVTGLLGIHSGIVGHGGTAADKRLTGRDRSFRDPVDENNLFNLFRKAGMHTVSISTFPERHSAWWFNAGFNETYNVGRGGMESGEEVLPVALDWLNHNSKRENWFLHLNLWDPHTPYRAPMSFGNPFENEPLPEWITDDVISSHLKHVGPHSINEINMYNDDEDPKYPRHPGKASDLEGIRRIFDGYDCGVKYADYIVGQVLDRMRELNVYDNTAIIITSDHGENLGELGIYGEHATADYPTCHIPMIIKWPGGRKNACDSSLRYNIDLAPTLASLLGVESGPTWDGESYEDAIMSDSEGGRPYIVLSQQAHVCQRSVRMGDWLYVRTIHDGYHLFPEEMLFNIKDDPYEQHNVADGCPEVCGDAARKLLNWQESMMKTSASDVDPMWTVVHEEGPFHIRGHLEQYLLHLEKTGRKEGAAKLREKYLK